MILCIHSVVHCDLFFLTYTIMIPFDPKIQQYIVEHTTPEDPVLAGLNRETHLTMVHPQMLAGHHQGKILEMISHMIKPRYVLEIGSFTGYSAICLAKGLSDDGRLFTIEKNDELVPLSSRYYKKAGLSNKIIQLTGDANAIIPRLKQNFDLVYIDAEKDEYPDYYNLVINKVTPGGIILADNVLWGGKVLEKLPGTDHFTSGIQKFNEMVQKDERVENVILPVRDGLVIIRKN